MRMFDPHKARRASMQDTRALIRVRKTGLRIKHMHQVRAVRLRINGGT